MKETILKTNIKRESGYLYFTGTDEKGNVTLCRTEMKRGKKNVKFTPKQVLKPVPKQIVEEDIDQKQIREEMTDPFKPFKKVRFT